MTFPQKLLDLRKRENLSQEALAEKLGVSRQAVSRWEGGTAMPDAMNLLQLSKLFGVSIDYLLKDDLADSQPVQQCAQKIPRRWDIISLAAGIGGWAVILILSTMIEVPVGRDVIYGNGYVGFETSPGYHLPTFIAEYRLYALCAIFMLLTIAGIALVFRRKMDSRRKEDADR